MQDGIKSGDHLSPTPKISCDYEIDLIKKNLKQFVKEGERLFNEHEKWALSEPRKSMAPIDTKLKLGGVNSDAYKAVAAGIKNQLIDVAAAIKSTQQAWDSDLKFALETQQSRVEALDKIIRQGASANSAFISQIKKEAKEVKLKLNQALKLYHKLV
ncbi:MAG: hypothetical protein EA381_12640, partial [Planctomycetaceae bacterium]